MDNNEQAAPEANTGEAEASFFETSLSESELAAMQGQEVPAEPEPTAPPADVEGSDDEPAEQAAEQEEGEIFLDGKGQVRDAKTGRFVPHAALHKERERRKEIETAYQQELERRAMLEGRIEEVNKRLAPEQGADQPKSVLDEELIDPEEDIFGAFEQQRRIIQELRDQSKQNVQRQQEQTQYTQVQQRYVNDAVAFSKENQDFADAYRYIKEGFHKELEFQGMTDPNQREEFIKREELGLVQNAFAQGRSPSEIIYNMAKMRGYTPKAMDENPVPNKLEHMKQAQAASNKVAQAGQGSSTAGVTYETLANMTDDEMYEWASKNPQQFKKMFEGM